MDLLDLLVVANVLGVEVVVAQITYSAEDVAHHMEEE
jgi:hypothetical protein